MEQWAQLYELWSGQIKAGTDLPFWQDLFVNFYQSFIHADRWTQYLEGLGRTLQITVMALILGVILGVIVAVLRTAHDQQRFGHKNWLLGVINTVCKLYTTIIRGTPMMVQLLIMGLRHFQPEPQFCPCGCADAGHQLRRLCGGDRAQRSDERGQRPDGGRPVSLGLNYMHNHALHRGAPGGQKYSAGLGQRVYHAAEGYLADQLLSAARSCSMRPRPFVPRPTRL